MDTVDSYKYLGLDFGPIKRETQPDCGLASFATGMRKSSLGMRLSVPFAL